MVKQDNENDEYKSKIRDILSSDKLAYTMIIILTLVLLTSGYMYVEKTDTNVIYDEPSVKMNILESDNGVKVDVINVSNDIDSIIVEYNNQEKKLYNVTDDINYNKGDGEYKIYYITEDDELKLYDSYTLLRLEDNEEFI